MTEEKDQDAIEKRWTGMGRLYTQGLSVIVIARRYGVSTSMVYTALDKLGLRKKGTPTRKKGAK